MDFDGAGDWLGRLLATTVRPVDMLISTTAPSPPEIAVVRYWVRSTAME